MRTTTGNWIADTLKMVAEQDYRVTPVFENGKTKPFGAGQSYTNPQDYEHAVHIGVVLDDTILLDWDGNKEGEVIPLDKLAAALGLDGMPCPIQENSKSNSLHWLFRKPEGIQHKCSNDGWLPNVDVKTGNQLMHLKQHKRISNGELPRVSELPDAPQALVDALRTATKAPIMIHGWDDSHSDSELDEANEILGHIDADLPYGEWVKVLAGIHHEFGPTQHGLRLADEWSSKGKKYTGTDSVADKFNSFTAQGPSGGAPATWASVCHMAREAGADLSEISTKHNAEFNHNSPKVPKPTLSDLWHTMDSERVAQKPEKREAVLDRFPLKATSAVVSMGGVGKTTWAVRTAALAAIKEGIETVFISAEDSDIDYQAKIHNLLYSHLGEYSPGDAESISGKIHVLNLRGTGIRLVEEVKGVLSPSSQSSLIGQLIAEEFPNVRLAFVETLSRFSGGEENEHMEAFVTACDRIAITANLATVAIHHMGKGQARDKITDLYSGRGGSTLGDNTRSFFVLTRIGSDYAGERPPLAPADDVEKGRVFEVLHVRYSFGPTVDPEYFNQLLGEFYGPVLQPLHPASTLDAIQAASDRHKRNEIEAISKIEGHIQANRGRVERAYFDTSTKSKLGLSQMQSRTFITRLIEEGTLTEQLEQTGKTKKKYLRSSHLDHMTCPDQYVEAAKGE